MTNSYHFMSRISHSANDTKRAGGTSLDRSHHALAHSTKGKVFPAARLKASEFVRVLDGVYGRLEWGGGVFAELDSQSVQEGLAQGLLAAFFSAFFSALLQDVSVESRFLHLFPPDDAPHVQARVDQLASYAARQRLPMLYQPLPRANSVPIKPPGA